MAWRAAPRRRPALQPDYADPASWSLHPGARTRAGAYFHALHATPAPPAVDVFYVHPTTYAGPEWNAALGDAGLREAMERQVIIRQLDPFAGTCRLFAPHYRQASARALREPGGAAAWDLAYADVAEAFRHFLAHHHRGRPFILFGHSQGALHASRLLAEIVEGEGLMPHLVAAYLVGIGVSEGLFGSFYRRATPASRPEQTGCVISWNSFLKDADLTGFLARTRRRDEARLGGRETGQPICLNPLSFDASATDMQAAANPGSLVGEPGRLPLPPLQPGLAGAACRNGVVIVDPPPPARWHLPPLPGGNMHMHDIALFHAALRADAQRRVGIFLKGT